MRTPLLLVLCALLLVACSGEDNTAASDATASPESETATLAPTETATLEPTKTPTPTSTPTPVPLTATQIFDRLSPSIAYISSSLGSGSGVLLDGGYVLTNAHVVWPDWAADLTFPDGSKFEDVPVAGQDGLLDIAILGPIDTDLPPLTFVDGESEVVGGDVLLIGYPGESNTAPQPALNEGLISRVRQWEEGGVTFFQTTSAVAGGQSGGVALLPNGEPFCLSGLRFTEANYGLIASAVDLMPRVTELIERAEAGRALTEGTPRELTQDRFNLDNIHSQHAYRLAAEPDTDVALTLDGPGAT